MNNRKILNGFYAMQGLSEKSGDIMRTVDKLDKIAVRKWDSCWWRIWASAVSRPVRSSPSSPSRAATRRSSPPWRATRGRNEVFDLGLDELTTVVKYLSAFGVAEEKFAVDLTIARGLDYYTGTVYETTMLDHPEIGSICSGGRYDNLAEYYTDKILPGVGISIGLTRLFYVLNEQGMLNPEMNTAPADVLILPMTEDLTAAISFAAQLRQAGIRTQLYTEQKKFKAKMSYADKLNIPFAVFLGEDEIKAGAATVKNLRMANDFSPEEIQRMEAEGMYKQVTLPVEEALTYLRRQLCDQLPQAPILDKAAITEKYGLEPQA